MSNFVGTLLSIFLLFLLVFQMFSLILILYKLDYFYICPLGKRGMSRHKLSTILATLGQLAVEILVILYVQLLIFL